MFSARRLFDVAQISMISRITFVRPIYVVIKAPMSYLTYVNPSVLTCHWRAVMLHRIVGLADRFQKPVGIWNEDDA